jgi:hypothetical protein
MTNPITSPLYKVIATQLSILEHTERVSNELTAQWKQGALAHIDHLQRNILPSGSGFDNGTRIDLDKSNSNKIVFTTSYHHMNENGYYDGWTHHTITAKACLRFGFSLTISGVNRNQVKDHILDVFHELLTTKAHFRETEIPGETFISTYPVM